MAVSGAIPGLTRKSLSFTERGFCVRVLVMDGNMCLVCGDRIRHLAWRQLALDDSHQVRFTACECGCGYRLIAVVVDSVVSIGEDDFGAKT